MTVLKEHNEASGEVDPNGRMSRRGKGLPFRRSKKRKTAGGIGGSVLTTASSIAKWYTLPGDLAAIWGTLVEVIGSSWTMALGIAGMMYGFGGLALDRYRRRKTPHTSDATIMPSKRSPGRRIKRNAARRMVWESTAVDYRWSIRTKTDQEVYTEYWNPVRRWSRQWREQRNAMYQKLHRNLVDTMLEEFASEHPEGYDKSSDRFNQRLLRTWLVDVSGPVYAVSQRTLDAPEHD